MSKRRNPVSEHRSSRTPGCFKEVVAWWIASAGSPNLRGVGAVRDGVRKLGKVARDRVQTR